MKNEMTTKNGIKLRSSDRVRAVRDTLGKKGDVRNVSRYAGSIKKSRNIATKSRKTKTPAQISVGSTMTIGVTDQFRSNMVGFDTVIKRINMYIREEHVKLMQLTPFKNLFNCYYDGRVIISYHNRKCDSHLRRIVESYDNNTDTFELGMNRLQLSGEWVSKILGIPCHGDIMVLGGKSKLNDGLPSRYFSGLKAIHKTDVERALMSVITGVRNEMIEDTVCILCLLLCVTVLFPNSAASIPNYIVNCIVDIETMKKYNWAQAVCDFLLRSVRSRKDRPSAVNGCVPILSYWFCEVTNNVVPKMQVHQNVPRFVRWDMIDFNRFMDNYKYIANENLENIPTERELVNERNQNIHNTIDANQQNMGNGEKHTNTEEFTSTYNIDVKDVELGFGMVINQLGLVVKKSLKEINDLKDTNVQLVNENTKLKGIISAMKNENTSRNEHDMNDNMPNKSNTTFNDVQMDELEKVLRWLPDSSRDKIQNFIRSFNNGFELRHGNMGCIFACDVTNVLYGTTISAEMFDFFCELMSTSIKYGCSKSSRAIVLSSAAAKGDISDTTFIYTPILDYLHDATHLFVPMYHHDESRFTLLYLDILKFEWNHVDLKQTRVVCERDGCLRYAIQMHKKITDFFLRVKANQELILDDNYVRPLMSDHSMFRRSERELSDSHKLSIKWIAEHNVVAGLQVKKDIPHCNETSTDCGIMMLMILNGLVNGIDIPEKISTNDIYKFRSTMVETVYNLTLKND